MVKKKLIQLTFDIKISDSSIIMHIYLTNKYFIPTNQSFNEIIEINTITSSSDIELKKGVLLYILKLLQDDQRMIYNESIA